MCGDLNPPKGYRQVVRHMILAHIFVGSSPTTPDKENKMEQLYNRCLRCNRKLKTEEARKIGYGKICLEKSKHSTHTIDLLEVGNEKRQKTN